MPPRWGTLMVVFAAIVSSYAGQGRVKRLSCVRLADVCG
jgi:hypothetical protein